MGSGASNSSISIDAKPTLSSAVRVSLSGWQPSPIRRQSGFTSRCILCSQLPRLAATCSMNKNLPPGLRTLATSSKSALLVHHTTEHQGADHEVYALVRGWQRFGDPVAELNLHVQAVSLFEQVRFHEWVWVHADPCDACGWEVMKVGAGTGADLQNCAGEVQRTGSLCSARDTYRFSSRIAP